MNRIVKAVERRIKGVFGSVFILFLMSASAQQSLVFNEVNPLFQNALDLYEKEKYTPALEYFEEAVNQITDVHSEVRIDAEYYRALCAVELFHANAEALLRKFIEDHPESPHIVSSYFNLAKFQFRKKKYEDVLDYLADLDPLDLNKSEQAEYHFKRGYSHFQLDEFDEAAKSFYEIKDTDNAYVAAARYYYAHISYHQKKYQTAAENFDKISNDPLFGSLVPYYLTQIYYLQEKYAKLLDYAPAVLDSAPPKREEEIRKLIGDAYYKTGKFNEALPNLEKYLKKNKGTKQDYYQIGYAYFKTENYEQAIQSLQKAIGDNDTISQSAYYYLGEANIKIDNKRSAKTAFRSAYQLPIDSEITEDALFNYAKTAYELSYHPYDDAIGAFEEYINTYPNSNKLNDAYEYLVGVYYTTKNYEEALKSIDRIKRQDVKLLEAKQRLAYYRGVELFSEKDFLNAVEKFKISLDNNYDPKLKATATYWIAESFYRLGDYDNADNYFSEFLASSRARSLEYYEKGFYNMGYTFYERSKYKGAIFWLREYLENANPESLGLINDAYLRIGDSYFIQKDYDNAISFYDKAVEMDLKDQDYAALQSAVASGVLGKYELKSEKLEKLIKHNKKSVYLDDAIYELGKTLLIIGKEAEALSYYNQLVNDYPNSNYLSDTYLKVGLIHYNREEDDLALNAFDKVVKNYSGSNSAKEALDKIRKIYIDKGDAQAFKDYINGVPFADISKNELDSTSYVIAENAYLTANCEKATRDFSNYLKEYPNGLFSLNAHYYRGDCEAKSNFYQEAVKDFEYVITQPQNKFTLKSLLALGELYQGINKNDSAIKIYNRILYSADRKSDIELAQRSLMRLYYAGENYDSAATYANMILLEDIVDDKLWQQAQLILAKTNFQKEDYVEANKHLDTLTKLSTKIAAEAKYMLAKTYYLQGDYGKCDTVIYKLVDQVPSYPYWIGKGFILLADNFIAKGDYYNARVTFQSVIDNADDEELIDIAKEKLQLLNEVESKDDKKEKKSLEIEFDLENVKDASIFEIDSIDATSIKEIKIEEEGRNEE